MYLFHNSIISGALENGSPSNIGMTGFVRVLAYLLLLYSHLYLIAISS